MRNVESAANRLARVSRSGQLVLLVREVQQIVRGVGPKTVRLAAMGEEAADHLALPCSDRAVDDGDLARSCAATPIVVDPGEARVDHAAARVLDELDMVGSCEIAERHQIEHGEWFAGRAAGNGVGQLWREPYFPAVGRGLQKGREARLVLRRDVEGRDAFQARIAVRVRVQPQHVHLRYFLARHEGQGTLRAEPDLGWPVDGLDESTDRPRLLAGGLVQRLLDVEHGQPVLSPYRHPELLAVARDPRLVSLPADPHPAT